MRLTAICLSLFVILFIAGCNRSGEQSGESTKNMLSGAPRKSEFGGCDSTKNQGISIRLNLWEPADSGKVGTAIRDILTTKSIQRINSYGDSASIAANPGASRSIKDAYEVFEKNYNGFKKDFPEAPGCWAVELKGDTVFSTPKTLFYQLDHYAFTGGAHPNSFRSYHAFDLKTGGELQLKSFVSDSVALTNLVEKYFRQTEKIAPEINLEEEGYFLLNNQFAIPVSWVFTPKGILFYYNPYEIAPYARGAIQFTIPYAQLEGIIDREKVF
ncbi:DUF3298 and DUF4163 domain-containing protein [Dyadobacter sp. CY326]|uniref:DUF3298 and DUF4163 domain-containing protein n=1 Tax=Dyadobacter sp. CY326 TaxID=2907300 RepID=UPI001F23038B|nr:DUF3298 and DUF4163 domain-containing protein [Dyadobacter sp. CY326]MCE7066744.1 DUF3298 and DUF4163 domain-containing protein [Dyadobacter sp. CY326]